MFGTLQISVLDVWMNSNAVALEPVLPALTIMAKTDFGSDRLSASMGVFPTVTSDEKN